MKKLFYLIVALVAFTVSVSSCEETKSDPRTYSVKIIDKWQDIGVDGYGENRRSVTKYHFKFEYRVVADSTHEGTGWMKRIEDVDGDVYHTYDAGKTYTVKDGSWAYWKFKLWR